jgi:hypothetical protein
MAQDNIIRGNIFIADGDIRLTFPRSRGYLFERNLIYAAGSVLFQAPAEGLRAMPRNLIHAGSGQVEIETLADYGAQERRPLAPRDGTIFEDPRLLPAGDGVYLFAPGSPAESLGLSSLDVSSAGPRPRF